MQMTSAPRRLRRATLTSVFVVVLLMLTSACGDDGVLDAESTTTTNPSSPAPDTTAADTAGEATTTSPPTSASSSVRDLDPCKLLTQEQANELMGRELQPALPADSGDDRRCTYPTPTSGSVAQVELAIGPGAKKFFDIEKELGHEFTPVAGIGDEAEIESGAIFFRVGSTWAALNIVTLDDFALYQPKVEELARQIAAQM